MTLQDSSISTSSGGAVDYSGSLTFARPGRHNLPADLTRFIGREPEIAEVKRLLSSSRLVTLAGSAGVGKTRLALKVAAGVAERYLDGVCLVELAPVADPTLVPKTVGLALGVTEQSARPIREALVDVLGPKQILLVLDNCEHLIQACADLVDTLLRSCPDLRVLATSRQSLHVPGETTWRVPSLTLPPTPDQLVGESLCQYDAIRLFAERAVAALPSFAIDDGNASTITRICTRLDGIPLAIELAAVRVGVLGTDQIDDRLSDRFRLLTDGSRTALPRQQTLRAALDWSSGLLSDLERILFRRLAVFAGGFSLEAAEAVCPDEGDGGGLRTGSDPHPNPLPAQRAPREGDPSPHHVTSDTRHSIHGADVLDLLAGLVDKSLAIADETGGSARYRLLETMREYGWEKLRAASEEAMIRDRHRTYFLALAEDADRRLPGADQAELLTRLERDHDNLRAALAWCLGRERDRAAALRLAGALAWFWRLRGHFAEGRRWLDLAIARTAETSGSVPAQAFNGAGLLAFAQNDLHVATLRFEEGLRVARWRDDWSAAAWALHGLGRVAHGKADYERANAVLQESLTFFRDSHDIAGVAYSTLFLANVARDRGDDARARALYADALDAAREVGDTWSMAWALIHAGRLTFRQGDGAGAADLYRESLVLCVKIQAMWGIGDCLWRLAVVMSVGGQAERAARLVGAEQVLWAKLGISSDHGNLTEYQQGIDAARATLGEARFNMLVRQGRAMTMDEAVACALAVEDVTAPPGLKLARHATLPTPLPLTPRERDVATLIARGSSNRAIAAALVITPRTADTHVRNILAKLELHTRAQVAAWAAEYGLLATDTR